MEGMREAMIIPTLLELWNSIAVDEVEAEEAEETTTNSWLRQDRPRKLLITFGIVVGKVYL